MKLSAFKKNDKILIYGFGREGKSTERFLKDHLSGIKIRIFDEQVKKYSKRPNFLSYKAIFVSPGISRRKIPKILHPRLTSNTEFFFDNLPEDIRKHVIGITGTKGKSTTATLGFNMLKESGYSVGLAGNIGFPVLNFYDSLMNGKLDLLVIELSSYQLENLKKSPGVAIFLNLYQDHLDRHGNLERYLAAKSNIWRHHLSGDILIVPDKWFKTILPLLRKYRGKIVKSHIIPEKWLPEESALRTDYLRDNLGSLLALSHLFSVPLNKFIDTISKFPGLPHRLQMFSDKYGLNWCDDSISVNPGSTLAAVKYFRRNLRALILGGQNRGQDFWDLANTIKKYNLRVIILKSEIEDEIISVLTKIKYKNYHLVRSFSEAVESAVLPGQGKIILLSPAAPSYDRYLNFQTKGLAFQRAVRRFRA